ncbi:MAG TPA: hypothetical protein VL361_27240 [Candidatus Limnocylindrales bacterium]|nr:hypothetical protein [Candidatus Limnocylindrales bacterium]
MNNLVSAAGKPEIVTLWRPPDEDPAFMKAVKDNRVLTLIQEPTSQHKAYAIVGFHQQPYASYLIFPKPLPTAEPLHVVGIKDELMAQPKVDHPIGPVKAKPPKRPTLKPIEVDKTYNVHIRRTAVVEKTLEIQAASQAEARKKALQTAESEPFDLAKAAVKTEVKELQ